MKEFRVATWTNPIDQRSIGMFGSEEQVIGHVLKHILAQPENRCWHLVFQALFPDIDISNPEVCFEAARRLANRDAEMLSQLYCGYIASIQCGLTDSAYRRWWVESGSTVISFTIVGMVVIFDHVIRTAFFAGQGNVNGQDRERKSAGRWSREGGNAGRRTREDRVQSRIRAGWDVSEVIYYEVYRTAVNHIRKLPANPFRGSEDTPACGEYGILKSVLPKGLKLEYKNWLHEYLRFADIVRGRVETSE